MMKKTLALVCASVMSATPMVASAYEAGDVLLRFGTATVAPESESDDLDQVAGASVEADDNTQVGISVTYMFTENWGFEVLAATPFSHDIEGKGTAIDGGDIGTVKHLPPTFSAQYYFMGNGSQFQPYAGVGLNYTTFFSEEAGKDAKGLGYGELELDDSIGLAVQAGFDYVINENWGINASVMYAQISTEATLTEASSGSGAAGAKLTVDYDLDPIVYRINANYKF